MCWWLLSTKHEVGPLNPPLNSPAGCTRTTGALLAFNDAVTCIASLYFNTVALHRFFFFFPGLLLAVRGWSRVLFSHVIPSFFFLLRSWKAVAERWRGPSLLSHWPLMQRFPPFSTLLLIVFRSVWYFWLQPFLRDGGGYYWKHEHQKVGDSGSYSAFVSGVCLHGRRFNW